MKIIIRQPSEALGRWKRQYKGDRQDVVAALEALQSPTHEDVKRIVGNDSWTGINCDDCGKWAPVGVSFGDSWSTLCLSCITAANAALGAVSEHIK